MQSTKYPLHKIKLIAFFSIFLLLIAIVSQAKSLRKVDVKEIQLTYDKSQLRIPGNSIQLGIIAITFNKEKYTTKGFLNGKIGWRNFRFEVEGGKLSNGKLHISKTIHPGKYSYIRIYVTCKHHPHIKFYNKIPLNYEKEIKMFTEPDFTKAPGGKFEMFLISVFDNNMELSTKNFAEGTLSFDHYNVEGVGGHFQNGTFYIYKDLNHILNHKVLIFITPKTNPSFQKNFEIKLDYIANYSYYSREISGFSGRNGNDGPDLDVYVDIYFDSILNDNLINVLIKNLSYNEQERYLINPSGGNIKITSKGGSGGDGSDGANGSDGSDGSDGSYYTETIVNADGSTDTETHQGPGSNGSDGQNGEDGEDGGDGGDGGYIHVYYTKRSESFLHLITCQSLGGFGGSGGRGGRGGSGGSGGDGNPSGSSGSDGSDGSDGWNGNRGRDGEIFYSVINEFDW